MTYLYGGLGALFLVLGGYAYWQHRHIASLEHQKAVLQAGLDKAITDNQAQSRAIDTLQAANSEYARLARLQAGQYEHALADLSRANLARHAAEAAMAKAQVHDQALPACKSLLDTDLAKVCPETAAAIQERAK